MGWSDGERGSVRNASRRQHWTQPQAIQAILDNVNQTVQQYWYSNAGRLVASRAKDSVTASLKQLSCLGFSTDDKFGPGPSFGNIEIVKEGSGALTTADYAYAGSDVGTGTSGPDAPTTVGTTSLTYDAFGRVASKGGGAESFRYDLAGRLVSATRAAGQSETLGYDPLGQLVSRTVNGQTTWYLGRVATLTTVGGVLQADVHVSVNGGRVASIRVGTAPRALYLHRDRLTSVVGTTLAGGVRGATYRYGAHGAVEGSSGDAGDGASELGNAGALRLSGGLLLMGARIYDPSLKVFLQPDPLAPHSYTYAAGDPINRWDPTGLKDEEADKPTKKCIGKECPSQGPKTWVDAVNRARGGPIGVLWSSSGTVWVTAAYSAATSDTPGAITVEMLEVALQKPPGSLERPGGSEWIDVSLYVDESSFISDSFNGGGGGGGGPQRSADIAGWGGVIASAVQYGTPRGVSIGSNLRPYRHFFGNQHVGVVEIGKLGGIVGGGFTAVAIGLEARDRWDGTLEGGTERLAVDAGFAGLGMFGGPGGALASGAYFLVGPLAWEPANPGSNPYRSATYYDVNGCERCY